MPKAGPNVTLGSLMFVVVFAAAALLLYGGAQLVDVEKQAAAEDTGPPPPPGGPVAVRIVARNILFDKRTITAGIGSDMTVTLVNEDAGVPHNIAFYTNRGATTKIAGGNIITGPAQEDLKFKAPAAAGNYFFRCDVHPDTMTGTFSVR